MRELKIKKRSGGVRIVVCPSRRQKAEYRAMLPLLQAAGMVLDVHRVQHGFVVGRSPVTCAKAHVGYEYTASWDLADCFDHIKVEHMKSAGVNAALDCFHGGVARQGLPTSPALCNIALAPLDAAIVQLLAGRGVYTRYADDLTISTDDKDVLDEMLREIPQLVGRHGQQINPRKTTVQCARAGRRIVVGVAVGPDGIYPTRAAKRRLRAARHRRRRRQARGLAEWCRLKPPNALRWAMANVGKSLEHAFLAQQVIARSNQVA